MDLLRALGPWLFGVITLLLAIGGALMSVRDTEQNLRALISINASAIAANTSADEALERFRSTYLKQLEQLRTDVIAADDRITDSVQNEYLRHLREEICALYVLHQSQCTLPTPVIPMD